MIPGNDIGGVVASVGVETDERLVGKRVVASTGGSGGYAERAAVDAGGIVEVPEGLELDDAVALLADGRTAMMLVRKAGLREGERCWSRLRRQDAARYLTSEDTAPD
jgi:NADPH2:quinone reductase